MTDSGHSFNTKQVADMIGVHKNTILNWIRMGKIPDVKRDWKGYRIWSARDVENLLKVKHKRKQLDLFLPAGDEDGSGL